MDRCTKIRLSGSETVPLTENVKLLMLDLVKKYGTGADTLRCLGLAVVDSPVDLKDMQLEDSKNFINYEVRAIKYFRMTLEYHILYMYVQEVRGEDKKTKTSRITEKGWNFLKQLFGPVKKEIK